METRGFGTNKKGEAAVLYTFRNRSGMVMEVTDFGATLYSLLVPDAKGNLVDVVLGYDDPVAYEGPAGTFFGATVGRTARTMCWTSTTATTTCTAAWISRASGSGR